MSISSVSPQIPFNGPRQGLQAQAPLGVEENSKEPELLPDNRASDTKRVNANNESDKAKASDTSSLQRTDLTATANSDGDPVTEDNAQVKENADSGQRVSDDQKQLVQKLQMRDTEVRAHEAAHLGAAGDLANGSASFDTQRGPDGRQYAVGGEVNIDTSPIAGDPQATLAKASKIQRAALAPAQPSGQDRQVATAAANMAQNARVELAQQSVDGNPVDRKQGQDVIANAIENEGGTNNEEQTRSDTTKKQIEQAFGSIQQATSRNGILFTDLA